MTSHDDTDQPSQDTWATRMIDDNLRRVYQDALEEDIPDRFITLLEQLRATEKTGTGDEGDTEK
jgi:hypothetical protein